MWINDEVTRAKERPLLRPRARLVAEPVAVKRRHVSRTRSPDAPAVAVNCRLIASSMITSVAQYPPSRGPIRKLHPGNFGRARGLPDIRNMSLSFASRSSAQRVDLNFQKSSELVLPPPIAGPSLSPSASAYPLRIIDIVQRPESSARDFILFVRRILNFASSRARLRVATSPIFEDSRTGETGARLKFALLAFSRAPLPRSYSALRI